MNSSDRGIIITSLRSLQTLCNAKQNKQTFDGIDISRLIELLCSSDTQIITSSFDLIYEFSNASFENCQWIVDNCLEVIVMFLNFDMNTGRVRPLLFGVNLDSVKVIREQKIDEDVQIDDDSQSDDDFVDQRQKASFKSKPGINMSQFKSSICYWKDGASSCRLEFQNEKELVAHVSSHFVDKCYWKHCTMTHDKTLSVNALAAHVATHYPLSWYPPKPKGPVFVRPTPGLVELNGVGLTCCLILRNLKGCGDWVKKYESTFSILVCDPRFTRWLVDLMDDF